MIAFLDTSLLGEMTFPVGDLLFWSINTHLNWPTFYWSQGWVSFVVFFLVCGCLVMAITTSLNHLVKETPTTTMLFWPMLITAAVLMQFLPRASYGIQVLPSFPWDYWGNWISFCFSLVAWLCLFVSATSAQGFKPGDQVDAAGFGIAMLVLTILLTPCHPSYDQIAIASSQTMQPADTVEQQAPSSGVDRHRLLVNQWKARYEGTQENLRQLQDDKAEVIEQLKSIDTPSEKNRSASRASQELAGEVEELERQIRNLQREQDLLQSSIVRAESKLRRIERFELLKQTVVLSDEESRQLAALQLELDSHLQGPGSESPTVIEIMKDQILKKIFGSTTAGN